MFPTEIDKPRELLGATADHALKLRRIVWIVAQRVIATKDCFRGHSVHKDASLVSAVSKVNRRGAQSLD
jgi:hypothetical protein